MTYFLMGYLIAVCVSTTPGVPVGVHIGIILGIVSLQAIWRLGDHIPD